LVVPFGFTSQAICRRFQADNRRTPVPRGAVVVLIVFGKGACTELAR
jgi:hypothetical protein